MIKDSSYFQCYRTAKLYFNIWSTIYQVLMTKLSVIETRIQGIGTRVLVAQFSGIENGGQIKKNLSDQTTLLNDACMKEIERHRSKPGQGNSSARVHYLILYSKWYILSVKWVTVVRKVVILIFFFQITSSLLNHLPNLKLFLFVNLMFKLIIQQMSIKSNDLLTSLPTFWLGEPASLAAPKFFSDTPLLFM